MVSLPVSIVRFYIIQDRDNNTVLTEISLADLRAEDPGLTSTGDPYCYAIETLAIGDIVIHLWPVPPAARTYHADVELKITDLVADTDVPLFPDDYHFTIVEGALMKEYERREKPTQYSISKSRYQSGLGDLKLFLARKTGIPGRDGASRFSQLGPYFPPGS